MADIKKFEGALDQMIHLMMDMKESLSEESPQETPQETPPQVEAQSAPIVKEDMDSFEELKTALMSDKWPEAVNPNLICDPESKQDKEIKDMTYKMVAEHIHWKTNINKKSKINSY